MGKKHTYEYVKSVIESEHGYKLLSNKYENAKSKLNIQCSNGHIYSAGFDSFNSGYRCRQCYFESKKPKLTYEQVKNYIEHESESECLLLTNSYTGCFQKLEILCKCKTTFITNFSEFQGGKTNCNNCNGKIKWDINSVRKYVQQHGYRLISTSFKSVNNKLQMECPNNHIIEKYFSGFLKGHRCAKCHGNARYTLNEVKTYIESIEGYALISQTYKNIYTNLSIKCNKGHLYEASFNNFKNKGHRCTVCNMSNGERDIENWLTKNNLSFVPQFRFEECKDKYTLPFDFALLDNNKKVYLLIEYDGEFHFEPARYSKNKIKMQEKLSETQRRDEIKNQYCKDNNISLLRIPYWDKDKIPDILRETLTNSKYN